VITFQLGIVDPMISVFYRFLLAALIMLGYCVSKGMNIKYSFRNHLFMFLLGIFLFGINYWLVYLAEMTLKSGLVAIVFSTIIFLNIINGAIFLGMKIRVRVVYSAILGFLGVSLIFKTEILSFTLSNESLIAFFMALISAIIASLGNIVSANVQRNKIPVVQSNTFGMFYGAIVMFIIALIAGKPVNFDFSFSYITSLLYLAIFGSAIAFWSFLTLLGRIGADKAGYVALVIPVIALILSTIFEDYRWNPYALTGVILILAGNSMVLHKKA
jgi:drug/metabolite transporter (DMT)-like permease